MTRNRPLTSAEDLARKDDAFIISLLNRARSEPGRMPYELNAIDRHIDRIEQRRRAEASNV